MINTHEILETITMIQDENLDIRTVTMGISLLDCMDADIDTACNKVYEKITKTAKNLVPVCEEIEKELVASRPNSPLVNNYDESELLRDLPNHNPKWWCKVENGYIMNLLGEKKNKIPYQYNS